jgi:hypothetical protein
LKDLSLIDPTSVTNPIHRTSALLQSGPSEEGEHPVRKSSSTQNAVIIFNGKEIS